ncbi:hypothetical protein [Flavobacterium hydrophilum]|uniref:Uncharacterized protein n=1 Tax=Flavobacterium hydrophilum TaxID=2211445 RepID=A0A2V4BX03_9FLAO|nr:hypothetical protein [Flavobacterium hydrophilum]PXY43559.1 hypothetical protein DMB68_18385 [Flavobacterium hydrophilum]
MKFIKTFFLITLFSQITSCQNTQKEVKPKKFNSGDLELYDLVNQVKSVKTIHNDEHIAGLNSSEIYKGQYIGITDTIKITFNKKGTITTNSIMRFSIKNKLPNQSAIRYDRVLLDSTSYKYGFEDNLFDYKKYILSGNKLKAKDEYVNYSYNEIGDCILIKYNAEHDSSNKVDGYSYFEYEYDDKNNWIKRTIYYNENKKEIREKTVREITYY